MKRGASSAVPAAGGAGGNCPAWSDLAAVSAVWALGGAYVLRRRTSSGASDFRRRASVFLGPMAAEQYLTELATWLSQMTR